MSGERKGKNRGRSHTTSNSSVDGNGDVEFSFVFLSSSSLILAVVAIRCTALSFDEESQHTPSFLFLAAVLSRQCVRRILRLVCVVGFGKSLLVDGEYSGLNVSSIAPVVDSEADPFPLVPPSSSLGRAYGKVLVLVPVF